jgi:diguanylate cyclase (GGDEF)-like protein
MRDRSRAEIKARGIALATGGLATMLVVILGIRVLGLSGLPYEHWLIAATATFLVQGGLLVIALRGLDRFIPGDRHFIYVPLVAAIGLLLLYLFLAPEVRFMILLGWFVALLFMAGLGGFHSVVVLSGIMTLGYFGVSALIISQGYPLTLAFEAAVAASAFIISIYAGFVFERLRMDRREMRRLRERLADMALTDALTQLPNRRHFEQVLRGELDRVARYGGRCAVAIVDVDFFKHYNDAAGHLAGDTVLRELAGVMRREVRLHDMVSRFGGEEFAMIMVNSSKEEAIPILERLRLEVEAHPFRQRDVQPAGRITVSAGLAAFPDDGVTYEEVLKEADDALYRAKREGRNRVRVAGQTLPDPAT